MLALYHEGAPARRFLQPNFRTGNSLVFEADDSKRVSSFGSCPRVISFILFYSDDTRSVLIFSSTCLVNMTARSNIVNYRNLSAIANVNSYRYIDNICIVLEAD